MHIGWCRPEFDALWCNVACRYNRDTVIRVETLKQIAGTPGAKIKPESTVVKLAIGHSKPESILLGMA